VVGANNTLDGMIAWDNMKALPMRREPSTRWPGPSPCKRRNWAVRDERLDDGQHPRAPPTLLSRGIQATRQKIASDNAAVDQASGFARTESNAQPEPAPAPRSDWITTTFLTLNLRDGWVRRGSSIWRRPRGICKPSAARFWSRQQIKSGCQMVFLAVV